MNRSGICVLALLLAAANAQAAVYSPPNAYNFSVWTGANESWFQYPETLNSSNYSIPIIQAKPAIGIALSGGGFRAATLGLGYLRALFLLNITSSAKYLTSNSGGSWLAATFSFQNDVDLSSYFGPYIPPEQLNLSTVQKGNGTQGNFAGVIANAGILVPGAVGAVKDVVKNLKPGDQKDIGAWSNAVGQAFLDPYGLNSDSATFTAVSTRGPVHQQALKAIDQSAVQVYTFYPGAHGNVSQQRPYPVMLGSILIQNSSLGFYPVEFTPLYIGCPAFFNNTDPPLGGGFVDPQGFNSPPPNPKPIIPAPILLGFADTGASVIGTDNGTLTTNQTVNSTTAAGSRLMQLEPLSVAGKPDFLVPLKQVMGISSSFITNMFQPTATITRELTGTEVLQYWNQIDFTGKQLAFGDGGSADNLAITPLLRRRIPKIIATVAASQNISGSPNASDFAGYQWDVAGLFGACPPAHPAYDKDGTIVGTPVDLFNRKLQVFPTAAYEQLFAALKNSTAAGGPTYHEATYSVLTNAYQAVFGGWQVEVLWVFNQQQTAWERALPQETASALEQARSQQQQSSGGLSGVVRTVENAADFALSQRKCPGLQNRIPPYFESYCIHNCCGTSLTLRLNPASSCGPRLPSYVLTRSADTRVTTELKHVAGRSVTATHVGTPAGAHAEMGRKELLSTAWPKHSL
eukprot:GHUV01005014.1.p1 GENE.GHUV01005014.1~~GHUV01005014.1.p1  ORF type:complete len:688 (+),score=137.57 GHUV01005014.1:137-2200(+)